MIDPTLPDFLLPYVREDKSVPPDFQRVTTPISLASEESILRSLASGLKGTEAIVTLDGDQATFWRRRAASVGQGADEADSSPHAEASKH